jgi:Ser/Thr protein kinase RdoA (MazF antagonist)
MNNEKLLQIASLFAFEGDVVSVTPLGEGFINDTYVVTTAGDNPNYILQRKNHYVFPNVSAMMENIVAVSEHIKVKVADPMRQALTVITTHEGKLYAEVDGNFWAACLFISGSKCYDRANSTKLARQGGAGIGRFQTLLADFNKPLYETIKGFHNIRHRFEQWDAAVAADAAGRVAELTEEISWIASRREQMLAFWSLVENGTIPTRVTHNDTKISNILFDQATDEVLCVIDLDTVMSSTSLNDFGDAIRSYTNTGAEDDKDLSRVSMDLDMFRAYAEGFLSERKSTMTASELEWLAFSGLYITYEQVLRFLMDYIDGDKYYRIHYPSHNLVRTHAQYKLLQSIEEQYAQMQSIIKILS